MMVLVLVWWMVMDFGQAFMQAGLQLVIFDFNDAREQPPSQNNEVASASPGN
jgi:hypothetical protein